MLVPITRRSSYKDTYELAERVSRGLEAENPGLVTTEWLKKKRRGVLLDHRQNGHGKTIAAAYSVRPKPGAPVSTPLRWEELGEKVRPRDFGRREALQRVERFGDLFEPVLQGGQSLARRPARAASLSPGRVTGPSDSVSIILLGEGFPAGDLWLCARRAALRVGLACRARPLGGGLDQASRPHAADQRPAAADHSVRGA